MVHYYTVAQGILDLSRPEGLLGPLTELALWMDT